MHLACTIRAETLTDVCLLFSEFRMCWQLLFWFRMLLMVQVKCNDTVTYKLAHTSIIQVIKLLCHGSLCIAFTHYIIYVLHYAHLKEWQFTASDGDHNDNINIFVISIVKLLSNNCIIFLLIDNNCSSGK